MVCWPSGRRNANLSAWGKALSSARTLTGIPAVAVRAFDHTHSGACKQSTCPPSAPNAPPLGRWDGADDPSQSGGARLPRRGCHRRRQDPIGLVCGARNSREGSTVVDDSETVFHGLGHGPSAHHVALRRLQVQPRVAQHRERVGGNVGQVLEVFLAGWQRRSFEIPAPADLEAPIRAALVRPPLVRLHQVPFQIVIIPRPVQHSAPPARSSSRAVRLRA